jgi:signal transduction histidine kinase/CheY-like chemotaxis protein
MSSYGPILNSKGEVVGVVGVDFEARSIFEEEKARVVKLLIISVIFMIIGFFVYIFLLNSVTKQNRLLLELNKKAEAASESKSIFLAKTSHEIRTPMNAILGMTELLIRRNLPPDALEDAMSIKQAGTDLLAIINDILDFSKIESGKLDIVPVEYLLSSVINDAISIIRLRFVDKPILFIVNVDSSLPRGFFGDVIRIRQVLLNILSNAVKYTHAGSITLTVSSTMPEELVDEDRIGLVFTVSDTGIGIKPNDMDHLFGEFHQFEIERNQGIEGTGLGLAISRNLCRLMDGDITVRSVYGKGSTFTVAIPQEVRDNGAIAEVVDAMSKRVLLYERNTLYADSVVCSLENLGVPVTRTMSADEFIDELAAPLENKSAAVLYQFAFVSGDAVERAVAVIKERKLSVLLVLLADMEEIASFQNIPIISMPAYTISIANMLNGKTSNSYREKANVRFIATDARLLIVDDIVTNLNVAAGLLALYQMNIVTCTSGKEAITLVKKDAFDIIFMDHMMPEMDGIETVRRIRALGGSFKKIPIVALTANAVSGMREMFLAAGFNDYLSKPIEILKLDEIMARWVPAGKKVIKGDDAAKAVENFSSELLNGDFQSLTKGGVDVQKGIVMTGGTEEGYRSVLGYFYKDVEMRLPCFAKVPLEKDLLSFTTNAHALKSASASIGAKAVSEDAAQLEAAGNKADIQTIEEVLPAFYGRLSKLADCIKEVLEKDESASDETDTALFTSMLHDLKTALSANDMRETNRIIMELENMPLSGKDQKTAIALSDYVLLGDYDEAISVLKKLIEEK